jgi:hypothetical protein
LPSPAWVETHGKSSATYPLPVVLAQKTTANPQRN